MSTPSREPEIVTRNGKAVAVIVPIKDYEELLERAKTMRSLLAELTLVSLPLT